MKKHPSAISIILVCGAIVATAVAIRVVKNRYTDPLPPVARISPPPPPPKNGGQPVPTPPPAIDPGLPQTKLLNVPFTPQAPTANWDELHGEACEEASSIMTWLYFNPDSNYDKNGDGTLDPDMVENEITKITNWEKENLGYYLDINTEETVRMMKAVYGLNARVSTDVSETALKKEIAAGNLVVFPAQGQLLGNPNFRRPGPPYHMIVLKGYTKDSFITNDPGTRKGANYAYTYDVLYNANGDWTHATHSVDTSKKMVIIVSK